LFSIINDPAKRTTPFDNPGIKLTISLSIVIIVPKNDKTGLNAVTTVIPKSTKLFVMFTISVLFVLINLVKSSTYFLELSENSSNTDITTSLIILVNAVIEFEKVSISYFIRLSTKFLSAEFMS